jgi:hypothetical protein
MNFVLNKSADYEYQVVYGQDNMADMGSAGKLRYGNLPFSNGL